MAMIDRQLLPFALCVALLFGVGLQSVHAQDRTLLGSIDPDTGQYTATEKRFTVRLPVSGTLEEIKSQINDSVTAGRLAVSVTTGTNSNTYRLEVSYVLDRQLRDTPFEAATKKTFDYYRRLAARAFPGTITELLWQPFELRGNPAALSVYKQTAGQNTGPRYHLFYLADFGNKLGFVWTDIPLVEENLTIEDAIIEGTAPPAMKGLAMLHSLKFK